MAEDNEGYVCGLSSSSEPMMNVSINGIAQEVSIDAGSVRNLIGEEDLKRLKIAGFSGDIEHCSKKLFACGGKKIDVVGQFEVEIFAENTKLTSTFIVVKEGRCILGNGTAQKLGILYIGPRVIPACDN